MAKEIYLVSLKSSMTIAETADEAFDNLNGGSCHPHINGEDFNATAVVNEELTAKLLILHRAMNKTEKFDYQEIILAIKGIIPAHLSLYADDIADCISAWGERLEDLDDEEFMDWLSTNIE